MAQDQKNSSRFRGSLIAGILVFIFIILYFSIRLIFFHKPFLSSILPGLYNNRVTALVKSSLPGSIASTLSSSAPAANGGLADATVTPLINYDALPIVSNTPNLDPNLSFGSFFDTFSGDGFIDTRQSTLYQDKPATALIFPPDYDWLGGADVDPRLIERFQSFFDAMTVNDFHGPYTDTRCLAAGCLTENGNSLAFNGQTVLLPNEVLSPDLLAISIASLSSRWVVGFTLRNGQNFRGLTYYFDGTTFTPLKAFPGVNSQYFGLYGFGGTDDDFLAIYGGYQGIAYRIRGDQATDVGQFFDIGLWTKTGRNAKSTTRGDDRLGKW